MQLSLELEACLANGTEYYVLLEPHHVDAMLNVGPLQPKKHVAYRLVDDPLPYVARGERALALQRLRSTWRLFQVCYVSPGRLDLVGEQGCRKYEMYGMPNEKDHDLFEDIFVAIVAQDRWSGPLTEAECELLPSQWESEKRSRRNSSPRIEEQPA